MIKVGVCVCVWNDDEGSDGGIVEERKGGGGFI